MIDPTASIMQHVCAYETIHRNNTNLQDLVVFAAVAPSNKQESFAHYVSASALAPSSGKMLPSPSRLKTLNFDNMCLTYDGLAAILQGCPMLLELVFFKIDMVGTPTQSYQHSGVKLLGSSLKTIFALTGPSLLSYFPRLTTISIYDLDPDFTMSSVTIKEELSRCCPALTEYNLVDRTGAIVPQFLTTIANDVTRICFIYRQISLETITAILLHQLTMKTIQHFNEREEFDLEKDEVFPVHDHSQALGRFLQLIPRGCPMLEELVLQDHEMDMDIVEQGKWTCKDLKALGVRIKGLDTKEKILKAIAKWRKGCWRRRQEKAGTPLVVDEHDPMDKSIEARVARHLLKFEKLQEVWLGYQTWTPI